MDAVNDDHISGQRLAIDTEGHPRVSVIMPFLDAGKYIREAVDSVLAQTYPNWELLLVDDGSTDGSTETALRYAEECPERIRYFAHKGRQNRGASASRNLGIRHARGEYLALLDADDIWLAGKLEHQVALLDGRPEAGSLYSNTLYWYSWSGAERNEKADYLPRLGVPPNTLLQPPALLKAILEGRASVPCTCSLLMRRSVVESIGGFEEEFRRVFTDQTFYTKLFLAAPVLVVDGCWEKYRQHSESSCTLAERHGELFERRVAYLEWTADYVSRLRASDEKLQDALRRELRWHRNPASYRLRQSVRTLRGRLQERLSRFVENTLPYVVQGRLRLRFPGLIQPPSRNLHFGPLHRVRPVSYRYGMDRGQPVDRYYVEEFLARRAADIHGRVLEIGDDFYTRKFGGEKVAVRDVLHVKSGNPQATIIGDLSDGHGIPSDSFDCIVVTQTLHLIFDMAGAVETIHRILKPGGVCVATVPGISQIEEGEWRDTWYWSLTELSARRLFEQHFGSGSVQVGSRGNVLAACAFLQGLAAGELRQDELDYFDASYPVLVTIRAQKEPTST